MLDNYRRPQLLIRQLLDRTKPATVKERHACVLGPQYDLFRYTNVTERRAMRGTAAPSSLGAEFTVAYEGLQPTHIVDKSYVRLYAENLEANLTDAAQTFTLQSATQANKIQFSTTGVDLALDPTLAIPGTNLAPVLYGRPLQYGDAAYITVGGVTSRRIVQYVERASVPGSATGAVPSPVVPSITGISSPVLTISGPSPYTQYAATASGNTTSLGGLGRSEDAHV